MAIICNYITDRLHFRSELERGIHADIIAVAYRRNLQIMSTGKRSGEYVGTRGSDYSPADNIPEVMFLSKHTPPGHITGERVSRSPVCPSVSSLKIRLGLAKIMLCIDNQVVDIALPVVYTLRTRQCFNVLRHFSSDSANLIIFRDVHAILNVKVSAIGISILAVILLSNLNYLVSLGISVLV